VGRLTVRNKESATCNMDVRTRAMEAGMIKRKKERERIEKQRKGRERGVCFCGRQRGRHGIYTSSSE